jgi:purine-cytosine permease-like protein
MKCTNCGKEFEVDRNVGYPGHVDPPSSYVAYIIICGVLLAIFGVLYLIFDKVWMLFPMGLAVFVVVMSFFQIGEAKRVCAGSGGDVCPHCQHRNILTWRS